MKHNMINYNPGYKFVHCHYINTESFVSSVISGKNIEDLHNLKDLHDFRFLNKNHGIFSNKREKVVGSFKKNSHN